MNTPEHPRAFVIGWPISHSRSPLIHNYWLKSLGLPGSYEKTAVPPEALEGFLGSLNEQGLVGGNVTLPHKEGAFALCAKTSPSAQALQAVNTVWMEAGELCGDNTDVVGFLASLDADIPDWDKACEKAVVLGAGGAARAIIAGLIGRGVERITIINRSRERAEELVTLAHRIRPDQAVAVADYATLPRELAAANLLVNTTSLGMRGQPPLDIGLEPLPDHAAVADIVYVPLETALITSAKARGLKTSGGLGMLLNQAVPGFERWFGKKPVVTPALRALVEADIRGGS
ncbi:MAG TPA: shikimate dehydrogenase [Methylovirgula sp.]|nr:shikimate dehydrogenase [Methylovirgula sp.]